jgi:hypothetical protein
MASARRKPGDGFFGHKPNHKNRGRPSPGNDFSASITPWPGQIARGFESAGQGGAAVPPNWADQQVSPAIGQTKNRAGRISASPDRRQS